MGGRDKGNTFFIGGAFCEAKNEIWRRRPQKQNAPRSLRGKKRGRGGHSFPPNPLFCPPRPSVPFWFLPREARQSIGILLKKSSHFVQ
jgi:hypothetical protein